MSEVSWGLFQRFKDNPAIDDPGEVHRIVKQIEALADDDEVAHSSEDDLHHAILRAIANGSGPAPELAKEGLKTLDIKFARWCA